jgi:hypothetical protein
MWLFHGAKDAIVPVAYSRALVDAVRDVGGTALYTEYPDGGHDIGYQMIADAYAEVIAGSDEGLFYWLFNQGDNASDMFVRTDPNGDGAVDIADAIFTLSFLFAGGTAPSCLDAADANDDGAVDSADAIAYLSHLFAETGPLPEPTGECGPDPTADALDCSSFPPCDEE